MSIQIFENLDEPSASTMTEADVSTGDALRLRMTFLSSQGNVINTQTQFADAKAGALMTVLGLVTIKGSAPVLIIIQDPLEIVAMCIMILAIGLCLATIMPRFSRLLEDGSPPIDNRYSWPQLTRAGYSGKQHGVFAREGSFADMLNAMADTNVRASRILARKFEMLRYAFLTGFLGSGLLLYASNN